MSAVRGWENGKPVWLDEGPGVGRAETRWFKGATIEIEHGKPEQQRERERRLRREQRRRAAP